VNALQHTATERYFGAYVLGGESGRKHVSLKCSQDWDGQLPEHPYKDALELQPHLVDVVRHGKLQYTIFWNARYFADRKSLRGLLAGDTVAALIAVNEYPPMVVRTEVVDRNVVGFTAYRPDGKAIISGEGTVEEDHVEFRFAPLYRRVRFACYCAHRGGAKNMPPPKAVPTPPPGDADR
jgi:hypothetical protein